MFIDGIMVLVIVQGLLLLPYGFEWLDSLTVREVDAVSSEGVPFYFYGQFIRYVEI